MTLASLSSNRSIAAAGERFREYKEVPGDRDLLLAYRSFLAGDITDAFAYLRSRMVGVPGLSSCRVKRLDSIVRKLRRQHAMDLVRMDDIIGFRIVVPSLAHQDAILASFMAEDTPPRIKDYRDDPRLGYRAVHLIHRRELQLQGAKAPSKYPYEIQLRTYYQHLWSSTSESFGEAVKEGGGSTEVRSYLDRLSGSLRDAELESPTVIQMEEIHQEMGLALYSLQFDHRSKELQAIQTFGDDVHKALAYFGYLESRSRDDLSNETVLLGCSSTLDELRVTHLRYFHPRGIPDLPARFQIDLGRPDQ